MTSTINPYESPQTLTPLQPGVDPFKKPAGNGGYRRALTSAMLQQFVFGIFTALLLDDGRGFRAWGVGFIGYWGTAGLILVRRPKSSTRFDQLVICYGFLVIFAIALFISH